MKDIRIKTCVLFSLCIWLVISCSEKSEKTELPARTLTAPDLKNVTLDLPKVEGYQTFMANCGICHSPRYIQNQPKLPEKTWAAIVAKMQKTYGAPVSDSAANIIVQYLVAIKGKS